MCFETLTSRISQYAAQKHPKHSKNKEKTNRSPVDPHPRRTTQPQLTPRWFKSIRESNSLVHRPLSRDLTLFPPWSVSKQSLLFSPWQVSSLLHLLPLSLSPSTFAPFHTQTLSFFLSLHCVIFRLLVWSRCKYFQYSITVSKLLHSLPGGKQNSHLSFSCEAFFVKCYCCQTSTLFWALNNSPFNPPPLSHNFLFLFSAESANCR